MKIKCLVFVLISLVLFSGISVNAQEIGGETGDKAADVGSAVNFEQQINDLNEKSNDVGGNGAVVDGQEGSVPEIEIPKDTEVVQASDSSSQVNDPATLESDSVPQPSTGDDAQVPLVDADKKEQVVLLRTQPEEEIEVEDETDVSGQPEQVPKTAEAKNETLPADHLQNNEIHNLPQSNEPPNLVGSIADIGEAQEENQNFEKLADKAASSGEDNQQEVNQNIDSNHQPNAQSNSPVENEPQETQSDVADNNQTQSAEHVLPQSSDSFTHEVGEIDSNLNTGAETVSIPAASNEERSTADGHSPVDEHPKNDANEPPANQQAPVDLEAKTEEIPPVHTPQNLHQTESPEAQSSQSQTTQAETNQQAPEDSEAKIEEIPPVHTPQHPNQAEPSEAQSSHPQTAQAEANQQVTPQTNHTPQETPDSSNQSPQTGKPQDLPALSLDILDELAGIDKIQGSQSTAGQEAHQKSEQPPIPQDSHATSESTHEPKHDPVPEQQQHVQPSEPKHEQVQEPIPDSTQESKHDHVPEQQQQDIQTPEPELQKTAELNYKWVSNEQDQLPPDSFIGMTNAWFSPTFRSSIRSFHQFQEKFFVRYIIPLYYQVKASPSLTAVLFFLLLIYITKTLKGFFSLFTGGSSKLENKGNPMPMKDILKQIDHFSKEMQGIKATIPSIKGGASKQAPWSLDPQKISNVAQRLTQSEENLSKLFNDNKQINAYLGSFYNEIVESHKGIWKELNTLRTATRTCTTPTHTN